VNSPAAAAWAARRQERRQEERQEGRQERRNGWHTAAMYVFCLLLAYPVLSCAYLEHLTPRCGRGLRPLADGRWYLNLGCGLKSPPVPCPTSPATRLGSCHARQPPSGLQLVVQTCGQGAAAGPGHQSTQRPPQRCWQSAAAFVVLPSLQGGSPGSRKRLYAWRSCAHAAPRRRVLRLCALPALGIHRCEQCQRRR
jgi:hypothetical protein